jgi:hypothetical protein
MTKVLRLLAAASLAAIASGAWGAPAQAAPVASPGLLRLQTVPPVPGVVVKVDGATVTSNDKGQILVSVRNFVDLEKRLVVPETAVTPDRIVALDRFRGELASGASGRVVEMGLRTRRLVSWEFVDRFGNVVTTTHVESMRLRSSPAEVLD